MYSDLTNYLLERLLEGEALTKKHLKEGYLEISGLEKDVSDKTIQRKIKALKNDGWDIRHNNNGYQIVNEDQNLNPTTSNKSSYEQIASCVIMFGKCDQTISPLIRKQLPNLKKKLLKQPEIRSNAFAESSFVDASSDQLHDSQMEPLGKLTCYIINKSPIQFLYRKLEEKEAKLRKVFPIQLKERDGIWYLIGYDYGEQKGERFNMKRISDVRWVGEKKPPAEVVQNILQKGVFSIWDYGGEGELMKIKLYDYAAHYIRETKIHPRQEIEEISENEVIVSFKSSDFIGVNLWMRKFAPLVKPLEPSRLRDDFRGDLEKALKRQQ